LEAVSGGEGNAVSSVSSNTKTVIIEQRIAFAADEPTGSQTPAKRIRKNVRVRIPFRRQQMFAAAAACSRCQRFRHVAPMDRLEVGARVQPWPKDIVFQGLLRAKRRPLFHPSCPVASLRPPRVARHIQCIVCRAAERRSLVHE
jgi:hypothetical protein